MRRTKSEHTRRQEPKLDLDLLLVRESVLETCSRKQEGEQTRGIGSKRNGKPWQETKRMGNKCTESVCTPEGQICWRTRWERHLFVMSSPETGPYCMRCKVYRNRQMKFSNERASRTKYHNNAIKTTFLLIFLNFWKPQQLNNFKVISAMVLDFFFKDILSHTVFYN